MQRIYVDERLRGSSATIADGEITRRLHSVLRMKRGDRFQLFDSGGAEYLAEITAIDAAKVSVGFVENIVRDTESKTILHLYPALFKRQRFEWMLEKCVELGVRDFFPVESVHAVVKEHGDAPKDRWKKIAISAAEQSEQVRVPGIAAAQTLAEALKSAAGQIVVAAERMADTASLDDLRSNSEISLFIGPEGGWSPEEITLFKEHGAKFIGFGSNILRAETACIAGCALLLIR